MLPKIDDNVQVKPEPRSTSAQPKLTYKPFAQKTTFICKFCGGKSCKHENWLTHPPSAIKGLNSDWVTSNILATQRPSTRINKEFNVIKSFQDNDINAIFNLQEPGEHPYCGDGIHPQSGFSYFPEEFYDHGIYYFNYGWKDMTATSTDVIIRILKQMSFSLAEGHKIAIHCHAGRGRTGLIIAAWLIYKDHMTAKEAIAHVRSKRKGSIQSKSQEEVLFKLEKELRESRIIFHTSPKFKLEDYLFHQKKILPLSYESETRFVPNLVLLCLERLEILLNSGLCTARDIALAFSSPNDMTYYRGEWSGSHEKSLRGLKDRINIGNFTISEIDDPRFLAQCLLDFFDHFASPSIRSQFIEIIHAQIHNQDQLTRSMKDQFFKQLDKKEFLLVECFAKFFSKLVNNDETITECVRKAVFRVCISLVLERKKWDKLFLKRSLIKDHHADDKVSHLHVFILKWIENFNQGFTEQYMVCTSPLKISEKKVQEKMERGRKKHGTYLDRVLGHRIEGSDRSSPVQSVGDMSPIKITKIESSMTHIGHPSQQVEQENENSLRGSSPDLHTQSKHIGFHLERGSSPDSQNMSSMAHSRGDFLEKEDSINLQAGTRHQTVVGVQGRGQSSSFSPSKIKCRTVVPTQPRVSLLGHNQLFIEESKQEEVNLGDSTLKKNYDNFFSQNDLYEGDTPRGDGEIEQVKEEEGETSEISEKDRFMELVEEIDNLNLKKKQLILERLTKELAEAK